MEIFAEFVFSQPFYHNLAGSAKAYVQMEQERDTMRAELERLCREFYFCFCVLKLFLQYITLSSMCVIC